MVWLTVALMQLMLLFFAATPATAFSTPSGTSGLERGSDSYMTGDFTSTGSTFAGKGVARSADGYLGEGSTTRGSAGFGSGGTTQSSRQSRSSPPASRVYEEANGWGILNLVGVLMCIGGTILFVLVARAIALAPYADSHAQMDTSRLLPH